MSDTKEIIEYVRGCINGVQKVTFGKDTVKSLLNVIEQAEASSEKAEANVARLTKMVDWLAEKCAMHCHDKDRDDILCSDAFCDIQTCWGASGDGWKEAASRAVADSEVNG